MGREKARLPWGSATLIEHVIETLRPVTDELLVVVKDARAFADLGVRVVEDLVPDAHALGGLCTGLTLAAHEQCFVCACDTPFLNAPLVRFLYEQLDGGDLVIPNTARGLQPLHAAYARSALPAVQEQLRQERWDLCVLASTLRTRIIEPEQWRPLDRGGRSFCNLNTPADYVAARRLAVRLTRIIEPAERSPYHRRRLSGRTGPHPHFLKLTVLTKRSGMPMAVYLDNAATSFPKPPRVYERLREYLERYGGCPGRGSYRMAKETEAVIDETRALLAELLGVREPRRMIFTLNATDALNMAIKGAVVPGDHVVTTALEHNSVMRPLNRLERTGLIRVTRIGASSEGLVDPDDIRRALIKRTKLVAVIHGSNVTGALQPIGEIGPIVREHGALFLVDAAQTAGAVPIDVEAACIDLLAFPGHKALLGLPGTGGLCVGPRAGLSPWREGGTGVLSELPLQPDEFPYALEAGSPNTLGLAGLREAIQFILQYGVAWIRSHELSLIQRLLDGLRADGRMKVYGPTALEHRIAAVSVNVAGYSPAAVAEFLDQTGGIAVRPGLHCAPGAHQALGTFPEGTVRISPGYFTKEADIDVCLEALKEAANNLPRTHDQRHEAVLRH